MSKSTFGAMAGPKAKGEAPRIGVGMLGYAFMGKAHSNAYKNLPYMMYPAAWPSPSWWPSAAATKKAVQEAAEALRLPEALHRLEEDAGRQRTSSSSTTAGPTTPTPSPPSPPPRRASTSSARSRWPAPRRRRTKMLDAVKKARVKHQVAFNYRFVPAMRQAYELIKSGALGQIYHFRAVYLQEWIMPHYGTPMIWRLRQEPGRQRRAGRPGRAHHRPGALPGRRDRVRQRADADVHRAARRCPTARARARWTWTTRSSAVVEFENGASARWRPRASRPGARTTTGSRSTARRARSCFNLERLNELEVYWVGRGAARDPGLPPTCMVTEGYHPFWSNWWPHGPHHRLGAHLRARDDPPARLPSSTTKTWPRWAPTSRTATATRSSATPSWSRRARRSR